MLMLIEIVVSINVSAKIRNNRFVFRSPVQVIIQDDSSE